MTVRLQVDLFYLRRRSWNSTLDFGSVGFYSADFESMVLKTVYFNVVSLDSVGLDSGF